MLMDTNIKDHCDLCQTPMKYRRLSPTYLYVCQDCRVPGMKKLGDTHQALEVSFAVDQSKPTN